MRKFKVELTATRTVFVLAESAESAEEGAKRFQPRGWTLEEAVCWDEESNKEEES